MSRESKKVIVLWIGSLRVIYLEIYVLFLAHAKQVMRRRPIKAHSLSSKIECVTPCQRCVSEPKIMSLLSL